MTSNLKFHEITWSGFSYPKMCNSPLLFIWLISTHSEIDDLHRDGTYKMHLFVSFPILWCLRSSLSARHRLQLIFSSIQVKIEQQRALNKQNLNQQISEPNTTTLIFLHFRGGSAFLFLFLYFLCIFSFCFQAGHKPNKNPVKKP